MTAYPDDGELTMETAGKQVSGWQEIRLSRGIERFPSDFEIAVTEKLPGSVQDVPFIANDVCRIRIGSDLVLTGYVERYSPSITADSHEIRVQGRSAACDLLDCVVDYRNHPVLNQMTLLQIATLLGEPYGVAVQAWSGSGPVVPQLTVNLAERVYEVVERVARYSAMLAYDNPSGGLVLAQVGTRSMASGVTQGLNVLAAGIEFALDQRFTEYHAFRNSTDSYADISGQLSIDGNEIDVVVDSGMAGFVRPDGKPRVRKFAVVTEQMNGAESYAVQRARWEMARRYGRCQVVRATVDSWRDSAGTLWEPNCKLPVKLPALKLAEAELVISEVTYLRDAQGTRAELTMMPAEAFQPEPAILSPFDAQLQRAMAPDSAAPARDGRKDQG